MESDIQETNKFRRYLPQVLASTAKNLLLVDLGMAVSFPTIVIPVLRGIVESNGSPETISITAAEASWFASISFICQPIGSLFSGWITDPIGRKLAMILVNIPHIIGWLIYYNLQSVSMIYLNAIIMGLGVGFMEAPILTYVGEISEPAIRGILIACASIAASLGITTTYLLGTLTTWRNAALICLIVPVSTMIIICFVPESPLWLLSKQRPADALKSLQWLRGWVSPEAVQKEFNELERYHQLSTKCKLCRATDAKCPHDKSSLKDKFAELFRRRTLKPFLIVILFFVFSQFGYHSMRPYLVQIFQAFDVPIDAKTATFVMGLIGMVANTACTALIKCMGKRCISLISIGGAAITCICLGIYGHCMFPPQWNSFDKHIQSANASPINYIPLALFFSLAFLMGFGISSIPWMLLSEVFPLNCRGIASGVTAACNYFVGFISTKTYFNLEQHLYLPGIMWLYGAISIIGFVYLYFCLPETEGRSLEEIERFFALEKTFAGVDISKNKSSNTGTYLDSDHSKQKALK